jgi:hypothetical protein
MFFALTNANPASKLVEIGTDWGSPVEITSAE